MHPHVTPPQPPTTPTAALSGTEPWLAIAEHDAAALHTLQRTRGVNFAHAASQVWEADEFVYLPVTAEEVHHHRITRHRIVFALSNDQLITLQPSTPLALFDKALARMRRLPHLKRDAHGIMYALLWSLNESDERVVEFSNGALDEMSGEIQRAVNGRDERGSQLGVGDIRLTMSRLNETEASLAGVHESQLRLIRAARHLRMEVGDVDLGHRIDVLIADMHGVVQHASSAQDRVRFMQQSIMTTLDLMQNEIVKVFTIITAVFLPPTLIGTFYGMNFTNMPELQTQHGYLITTILTFIAAVIPLWYIKRKGWLR